MTSAAADWSHVDMVAGGVPVVSMPTIVSSSDLFDGELFGDELIDIYNSTVDGHHDDVGIPLLDLIHDKSKVDNDEDHPGARVAAVAAAMDDGLGAFRPSTSFNDLSTLLQTEATAATEAAATATATEPAVAAAVASKSKTTANNKKRSGSESSSSGTKRKAAAAAGGRRASPKKPKATKVVPATATVSAVAAAAAATEVAQIPAHAVATAAAVAITAPSPSPDSIEQGLATSPVTPDGTRTVSAADVPSTTTTAPTTVAVARPTPEVVTSQLNAATAGAAAAAAAGTMASFGQAAKPAPPTSAAPATKAAEAPSMAPGSGKSSLRIDTSTAHIKALTGNNWVAACSGTPVPPPTTSSSSVSVSSVTSDNAALSGADGCDSKSNNRARRQNLTPDERARQNRDRNREHARNTRLRKKAYVEELKRTLTELVAQRDKAELEKRQSAQRELEQREVRFRVIEEFLKLRGRNEVNFSRWAAILEDGFSLVVPVCDFYAMQQPPAASFEQQLDGVSNVMADASNFSAFLQSLRGAGSESAVTFSYQCDRKNFFMDGCNAVMEWTATSLGAANNQELALKGIIRGKFSPASNKLISCSMSFDTGIVSTQLRMRAGAAAMVAPTAHQQETADAEAAAQADAILDSLEMPHVDVLVPSSIVSVMLQPASVSDSCSSMGESTATHDKDMGMSSDESMSAEA